jgi:hypothetical protein
MLEGASPHPAARIGWRIKITAIALFLRFIFQQFRVKNISTRSFKGLLNLLKQRCGTLFGTSGGF